MLSTPPFPPSTVTPLTDPCPSGPVYTEFALSFFRQARGPASAGLFFFLGTCLENSRGFLRRMQKGRVLVDGTPPPRGDQRTKLTKRVPLKSFSLLFGRFSDLEIFRQKDLGNFSM